MTIQVAVRLPDTMVASMDDAVSNGWVANKSRLIITAVERELRRMAAENDFRILTTIGAADDLDELVNWTNDNYATIGNIDA